MPLSPESLVTELVTVTRAAELLGVNRFTFYRWLKRGYLPHHRFGRAVRISLRDLSAWIEKNRQWATPMSEPTPLHPPSVSENVRR